MKSRPLCLQSFMYLVAVALGCHHCSWAFLVAATGLVTVLASVTAGHRRQGAGSAAVARGLSCSLARGVFAEQ